MQKKLFLTSEGIQPNLRNIFLSLLTKAPMDTKVLFVTTAAYGESNDVSWLENHRRMLREVGVNQITDFDLRFNHPELRKKLDNSDLVFVAGGNTYFLLKHVRESGFGSLVKEFIRRGGLYVGNSAGSYIVGPTIEQTSWKSRYYDKNKYGMTDFSGLKIVPFVIFAHFEEKWRKDVEFNVKRTNYPLIAINDKQAVLVENGEWKIVGEGERLTFNFKTP